MYYIQDRISVDVVNTVRKKRKRKYTILFNWACKTLLREKKLLTKRELTLSILYKRISH